LESRLHAVIALQLRILRAECVVCERVSASHCLINFRPFTYTLCNT
jgi:hypothetical protein